MLSLVFLRFSSSGCGIQRGLVCCITQGLISALLHPLSSLSHFLFLYPPFNFPCHISQLLLPVFYLSLSPLPSPQFSSFIALFSSSYCSLEPHLPTPTSEYCFPLHNHGRHLILPLSFLIPLFLRTNRPYRDS